ncbi:MAG: TRAP transporter TatT component family protein [Bacteriovoracaceae bacterium]|jgi:hypothetical protein|nr:TRAP transporter TatT component family protein [Bacteriovoracaceae bacterium]
MQNILILSVVILLVGCSTIEKRIEQKAIDKMTTMLDKSSLSLTRESDWDYFKESSLGNLKLLETLYSIQPNNKRLLKLLIKGHGGYALGVFDTLALEDKIKEEDFSWWRQRAISHYTRAVDYGIKYLALHDVKFEDLKSKKIEEEIKKFDKENVTALFYFAQAWGQIINYRRTDLKLIGEIGYVEYILNWACKTDPFFESGLCDMYKAVFEAQRPRVMGGDPKLAKELFKIAIKRHPKNLLLRVNMIEYLLIPTSDLAEFIKQKEFLNREFWRWSGTKDYSRRVNIESDYTAFDPQNLFNAIAKKRFWTIKKYEKDLF